MVRLHRALPLQIDLPAMSFGTVSQESTAKASIKANQDTTEAMLKMLAAEDKQHPFHSVVYSSAALKTSLPSFGTTMAIAGALMGAMLI